MPAESSEPGAGPVCAVCILCVVVTSAFSSPAAFAAARLSAIELAAQLTAKNDAPARRMASGTASQRDGRPFPPRDPSSRPEEKRGFIVGAPIDSWVGHRYRTNVDRSVVVM